MAKPLKPESVLIRKAIAAYPDLSSSAIADYLNKQPERDEDGFKFESIDVTIQRNALKKKASQDDDSDEEEQPKPYRLETPEPKPEPVVKPVTQARSETPLVRSSLLDPLDVLDAVDELRRLAERLGGYDSLRKIIDRIGR